MCVFCVIDCVMVHDVWLLFCCFCLCACLCACLEICLCVVCGLWCVVARFVLVALFMCLCGVVVCL